MKNSILLFFIFMLAKISLSETDVSYMYMPLKIGNSWTYTIFYNMTYCCKTKVTIISDTTINGKKYFRSSSPLPASHVMGLGIRLYRVDSVSGNFYGYYDSGGGCIYYPNEVLIDSLSSNISNTYSICPSQAVRTCTNIQTFPAPWGQSYTRKRFQFLTGSTQTPSAYFLGLGIAGSADGPLGEVSFDIIGCVINSIVYGDTTLTSINNISNQIPEKFTLYQNYPNPFNPATKIKFDVPNQNKGLQPLVQLKIYDALAREVATLVNQKLSAGSYEVEFYATGGGSNLSSGIYFYHMVIHSDKMETGEFSEVKRMILLK